MNERLAASYAHCGQSLREANRDQWLACLFAPAQMRAHLHALHAFGEEIGSLRDRVSQPMAGEIRLQYWRDVLAGRDHGQTNANPVAAALLATIEKFRLPLAPFQAKLDAHLFDLYDDPMPDVLTLEAWCGETISAPIRLACLILSDGADPGGADGAGHAGVALAIIRILRGFGRASARGQCYLPGDILARHGVSVADILNGIDTPGLRSSLAELRTLAGHHAALATKAMIGLEQSITPAFLPLCLVDLYVRPMADPRYLPFQPPPEIAQWRRQWALWRAAR